MQVYKCNTTNLHIFGVIYKICYAFHSNYRKLGNIIIATVVTANRQDIIMSLVNKQAMLWRLQRSYLTLFYFP